MTNAQSILAIAPAVFAVWYVLSVALITHSHNLAVKRDKARAKLQVACAVVLTSHLLDPDDILTHDMMATVQQRLREDITAMYRSERL